MKTRFWLGAGFLGIEFLAIIIALVALSLRDFSITQLGIIVGTISLLGINILAAVMIATGD